ncbi:MAG: PA0069 family radical SAM protein [Bacteroidota bacterium]|nr:PA0069 family radical SAM protein [Bacteroidota bacterium]
MEEDYIKGRGAQFNAHNPFSTLSYVSDFIEGIDESMLTNPARETFLDWPKKIVNKIDSPDLNLMYSVNPYQGCEHGCIYCYARNSHQYWGYSAGLDFETKLFIKRNAPELLEKHFLSKNWRPAPISLSGNTDCYQPLEKEEKITRKLLSIFSMYKNPVGMITKNSLILRDIDILKDLAADNLVHVYISITSLNEALRLKMEPRTATAKKRLQVVSELAKAGIPVGVMVAPIIPGLNNHEIPAIIKVAAENGAMGIGYTLVRLNGSLKDIFKDWLVKNFEDKASKVWNQISEIHGGDVSDSKWGRRMKGSGPIADAVAQLFNTSRKKYMEGRSLPELDLTKFRKKGNYNLF